MAEFGDILKQIRESREMSQEELADLLCTSKQVISRYETRQRIPKLSTVKAYADKLGVALSDLSGGDAPGVGSTRLITPASAWHTPLDNAYAAANMQTQENICKLLDIPHINPK